MSLLEKLKEYKDLLSTEGFYLRKAGLFDQFSLEFELGGCGREKFSLLCLPDKQKDMFFLGIRILDLTDSEEDLSGLNRLLTNGCERSALVKFIFRGQTIIGISEFISRKECLGEDLVHYLKNLMIQKKWFIKEFERQMKFEKKFENLN